MCQKISMRQYATSSPTKEWMQKIKEERLQGIAEGASSHSPSGWPARQPRRSPEETSVRGPIVA